MKLLFLIYKKRHEKAFSSAGTPYVQACRSSFGYRFSSCHSIVAGSGWLTGFVLKEPFRFRTGLGASVCRLIVMFFFCIRSFSLIRVCSDDSTVL